MGGLGIAQLPPPPVPPSPANPEEPAVLVWSQERPLQWEDFWGHPPEERGKKEAANIALVLEYAAAWEVFYDGIMKNWGARLTQFTSRAYMDRSRSWVLPHHRTPALLQHEQGHFDLLEVFRRVLEKELRGLVGVFVRGETKEAAEQRLKELLARVYARVWQAHACWQARYDRDTDHGRDEVRQREWERRIARWLQDPAALPSLRDFEGGC